jgi:hypothetical protein
MTTTGRAEQPSAWMVRFHRRSALQHPCTEGFALKTIQDWVTRLICAESLLLGSYSSRPSSSEHVTQR